MKKNFKIWTRELEQEPIKIRTEEKVRYLKQKIEELPEVSISVFERVYYWFSNGLKYTKVMYYLIKIIDQIQRLKMDNNQKTSKAGTIKIIVAALTAIIGIIWGKDIPGDIQAVLVSVAVGVYTLIDFFIDLFTNKPDDNSTD